MNALLFLYAESPVHAGGAESLGGIDLPFQREAGSNLPTIWGQSLKGALRQRAREAGWDSNSIRAVFGDEPPGRGGSAPPQPGALSVGDARLVAFPVPTLQRVFAWATSQLVLSRVARLAKLAQIQPPARPAQAPGYNEAIPAGSHWTGSLVLGDHVLQVPQADASQHAGQSTASGAAQPVREVASWAEWLSTHALPQAREFSFFTEKLLSDLLCVPDETLAELTLACADVVARVQLGEKKTVEQGPWYEENVPAETIMVSLLRWSDGAIGETYAPKLKEILEGEVLVLGGDETVGKGLLWCRYVNSQPEAKASKEGTGDAA